MLTKNPQRKLDAWFEVGVGLLHCTRTRNEKRGDNKHRITDLFLIFIIFNMSQNFLKISQSKDKKKEERFREEENLLLPLSVSAESVAASSTCQSHLACAGHRRYYTACMSAFYPAFKSFWPLVITRLRTDASVCNDCISFYLF